MCIYKYLAQDKRKVTKDYNDAGLWELNEATKICVTFADAVLSPDPSGKWLVLILQY